MSEWIEWNGGECPVGSNALVDARFKNGKESVSNRKGKPASEWKWQHIDDDYDIIAYRIHQQKQSTESLALKYPKYYKDVSGLDEIDVYMTHQLFQIEDPSGAIQHASKKLLLSGVRTGGKSKYDDIKEARDTLTRWLEINGS